MPSAGSSLGDIAAELASLLVRAGLRDLAAETRTHAQRLAERVPTLAVVGEFKRGKSSLINALLGEDLLPVGALPLTAVASCVRFGSDVRVTVHLLDGRTIDVDRAAIADYATERGNPGNTRRVAAVTITAPAPLLRAPLCVVDTPGIGSVFADVSEAARAVLYEADLALVVLSAEQPASRRELDFVAEVLRAGLPTFVVENKIDLVPPPVRDAVVDFVRAQVRPLRGGEDVRVFALSSVDFGASGGRELQTALVTLARDEGPAALARGTRRRLMRVAERSRAAVALRDGAQALAQSWQRGRRAELRQHVDAVLFRDLLDGRERVSTGTSDIVSRLDAVMARIEPCVEAIIERMPIDDDGRYGHRWAVAFEADLRRRIDRSLNDWQKAVRQALASAAADITRSWRARVAELINPILGPIPLPSAPSIDFPAPAVALPPPRSTEWLVLPGALGKRWVKRRAIKWWRPCVRALVEARRAAVVASVTEALKDAEQTFHRRVITAVEKAIEMQIGVDQTARVADERPAATLLEAVYGRLRDWDTTS